jgi:hypothetical protein
MPLLYLSQVNPEIFVGQGNQFFYEGEFNLTSGTSDPIIIQAGNSMSCFRGYIASGTATMEYTLDTLERIGNDTAEWETYQNASAVSVFNAGEDFLDTIAPIMKAVRFVLTGNTRVVITASYQG